MKKRVGLIVGLLLSSFNVHCRVQVHDHRVEDFEGFPASPELKLEKDEGYNLRSVALAGGAFVVCVLIFYKYKAVKKRILALFDAQKEDSKKTVLEARATSCACACVQKVGYCPCMQQGSLRV